MKVLDRLLELSDKKIKEFQERLIFTKYPMLGVTVPNLKALAKELVNKGSIEFLNENHEYYEEYMLHGLMIGYLKEDFESIVSRMDQYVKWIDNWSLCDSVVCNFKNIKKYYKEYFQVLENYLLSDNEYTIRFAFCCFLSMYVNKKHYEYYDKILFYCDTIKHEGYYVKMMIAWLLATIFVYDREKTLNYLNNCSLDDFTFNKTISKCRDSLRVSASDKELLKQMRR